MLDLDDTIGAPAAASGEGLRGVIRLSGPRSLDLLERVLPEPSRPLPKGPPQAVAGKIELDALGEIPVTAFVWPTTRSYTRQPSVELHFPASRVIEDAIMSKLLAEGARLARPGEFTLRAFLAGRVDLTQAEAILGVIHAESAGELQIGLQQLAGGVFGPIQTVREDLLCLLADVEAGLDFVEEDIEFVTCENALSRLESHVQTVNHIRTQIEQRSAGAAGWRVVLVGEPNAGKSSLFNALAGRDAAIVSPQAGTTRDMVEAIIELGGHRVALMDLAGLDRLPSCEVDLLAQQKAEEAIGAAHLVLHCVIAGAPIDDSLGSSEKMIRVGTKRDLNPLPLGHIATSAATGLGIAALREAIAGRLEELARTKSDFVGATGLRSAASLEAAAFALEAARERLASIGPDEAFAIDLRLALDQLGEITGAVVTDDILDRVFSRFCIGK